MRGRCPVWATALLLSALPGCQVDPGTLLPPDRNQTESLTGLTLVARFVHVTDTHLVDSLSPARFAGAQALVRVAWRPYEAYSTQLFDGIIRAVNRMHAGGQRIDFLLHTGDACDNVHFNELQWLHQIIAGQTIQPLSGPDDRAADQRPPPELDPYAPFAAEGLYRDGVHGAEPTIPWYILAGNHDVYAIGLLPLFESSPGRLTAPLPLPNRPGIVLPARLDPLAAEAHGPITPADPGPPRLFERPTYVQPNASRAYFTKADYVASMFASTGQPAGHGFATPESPPWYSVAPVAGLRLIGLDTTDRTAQFPGQLCHDGAISRTQLEFLRSELDASAERGELVIVAGHHPSQSIRPDRGVEVIGRELRDLLSEYSNVLLYLTGHIHRNRVVDRGSFLEIETSSTLDLPQEARVVEIWRAPEGARVGVKYWMFSHDDEDADDPLRPLRDAARAAARADKGALARQRELDPSGADPRGAPEDREGCFVR